MIFYSVVYTLTEEANLYCNMFMLLVKSLLKTNSFVKGRDEYYLIADKESAKKINQINGIIPIKCFIIPKPETHLEGMSYKYRLAEMTDIEDKDCWYLDVDMLFFKITNIFPAKDRIVAYQEGRPDDTNYAGDKMLSLPLGCSAGIFVYNFGPNVKSFFLNILRQIKEDVKKNIKHYTIEQVYFNRALEKYKPIYMDNTLISFNGHTNKGVARIINFAGDPGDGLFHYDKMFAVYLQIF